MALTRIAEMIKPGGIFRLWDVVYAFDSPQAVPVLERWMEDYASDAANEGWSRPELEEHVRDENSTFTWLLEPMIVRAGFAIEDANYSDDQMFARYICRKT